MFLLDKFEPSSSWFSHDPYGIHGIGHVARVLVWVERISDRMIEQGVGIDKLVVRWAAVLHDVGRINDGSDLDHGRRSAEWIERFHAQELNDRLTEDHLENLLYCCIWHVPKDSFAPQITPELACLKDADALDRARLYDLRPSMLRNTFSRDFVDPAKRLFEATRISSRSMDAWSAVRRTALQMNLWR